MGAVRTTYGTYQTFLWTLAVRRSKEHVCNSCGLNTTPKNTSSQSGEGRTAAEKFLFTILVQPSRRW